MSDRDVGQATVASGAVRHGVKPGGLQPGGLQPDGLQPDDVRRAASLALDALAPLADRDWSQLAHGLEWSCRRTVEHIASALDRYSLNLGTPSTEPFRVAAIPPDTCTSADLLALVRRRAAVLAIIAAGADPSVRGFHVWGQTDPAGYLAMGCTEILLHTHDVVQAFGPPLQPPDDLCRRVVARLFPWAPTDVDGWSALRWATGRLSLAGHADMPPDWAWQAPPVAEWDGTVKTWASFG